MVKAKLSSAKHRNVEDAMSDFSDLDRYLEELETEGLNDPESSEDVGIGEGGGFERLPAIFLIDRSGSTQETGDIDQINGVLRRILETVIDAPDDGWRRVRSHLDVLVVAYGDDADTVLNWTAGADLSLDMIPKLEGAGVTSMGKALKLAVYSMKQRLKHYQANGIDAFRGLIFHVTDGVPTDMSPSGDAKKVSMWNDAKAITSILERIGTNDSAYAWTFHFASRQADRELLKALSYTDDRMIDLGEADFDELFKFVRVSLVQAVE